MDQTHFDLKHSLAKTEVKYVKGVGPKRAEALATVGVNTALDLLYYFPRKYLDRSRIFKIKDARSALLVPDEVTFVGRIKSVQIAGRGRKFLFVKLSDETGTMRCVWFNGAQYFINIFKEGELIAFSGKVTTCDEQPCLIHPEYDHLEDEIRRRIPSHRRNNSCLSFDGRFEKSRTRFARLTKNDSTCARLRMRIIISRKMVCLKTSSPQTRL